MPLTDTALRNLKPGPKARKLADSRGLYLLIEPSGSRYWRYKYRIAGKERTFACGVYPDVSLKQARERHLEARKLVEQGIDPSAQKRLGRLMKQQQGENTFEAIAREWVDKRSATWAESQTTRVRRRLEMYAYPYLGRQPIDDIKAPELLAVLRRLESRSVDQAHRLLQECSQVMRYGIVTGRNSRDVCADLRGALAPVIKRHFSATLEPKRLGAILRAIDQYPGSLVVSTAMRLAPLVFVRPGELRHARWQNVDLEAAEWTYQPSKQRSKETPVLLTVPLSHQAVALLRELLPVTGPDEEETRHRGPGYLFPSARGGGRPMSNNAVLAAMRSLAIGKEEMTGHGFRAVARTLLDEVLDFRPDVIEHQLAHRVRDPNGRAYNRTSFLEERRRMMQSWADHLDHLKRQVLVMPARRAAS